PFGVEAVWSAKMDRPRVVRDWLLFTIASVAAAALNPNGLNGLVDPILFMSKPILASLLDWQSSLFSRVGPLVISILGLIALVFLRPVRMPLLRLLLLLFVLHMALSHRRHTNVFAIVAPMLLAEPIAQAFARPHPLSLENKVLPKFAAVSAMVASIAIAF